MHLAPPSHPGHLELLDVSSKVLSNIIVQRLHKVAEKVLGEDQNGFRHRRGCADATFAVLQALRKRREHGQQTWVTWIDLVRAFDSVPRPVLWACAQKMGVGTKLLDAIRRLHDGATMEFDIGGAKGSTPSRLGVRQGSSEGPLLFLLIMQAALESIKWPANITPPTFLTGAEGKVTGEKFNREEGATPFEIRQVLFADDAALLWATRQDLCAGSQLVIEHLRRYGLEVHTGTEKVLSKTECQFFPAKGETQEDGDTSPVQLGGGRLLSFCTKFKYLGTTIPSDLDPAVEITTRLGKAQGAFRVMRRVLTDRKLALQTRAKIYKVLVLTVLLYGSESWALTATHQQKLASFHRRCLRSMCHTNLFKTRVHRVTTAALLERAGLEPLIFYLDRRMITWAGKVARMSMDRVPRRMLTAWLPCKRPRGCAKTWGAALNEALKRRGIPTKLDIWMAMARDPDDMSWLNAKNHAKARK